jgi:hypothetical protein
LRGKCCRTDEGPRHRRRQKQVTAKRQQDSLFDSGMRKGELHGLRHGFEDEMRCCDAGAPPMNPFFYTEEAGAKGLPPLSPAPQIPAQPKPSLRSGRFQLTMSNTSCTIITPASLRSDCCSPSFPERRSASLRNREFEAEYSKTAPLYYRGQIPLDKLLARIQQDLARL